MVVALIEIIIIIKSEDPTSHLFSIIYFFNEGLLYFQKYYQEHYHDFPKIGEILSLTTLYVLDHTAKLKPLITTPRQFAHHPNRLPRPTILCFT